MSPGSTHIIFRPHAPDYARAASGGEWINCSRCGRLLLRADALRRAQPWQIGPDLFCDQECADVSWSADEGMPPAPLHKARERALYESRRGVVRSVRRRSSAMQRLRRIEPPPTSHPRTWLSRVWEALRRSR